MNSSMNKFLIGIFALIALIVNGCSDTSTTPTNSINNMPMTTGSYFIYNNYRLDSLTGQTDLNSLVVDSIIVGTSSTISGKSATAFDVYRLNNNVRTDYYTKEGQTISGYWQFIPPGITLTDLINSIIPQNKRWSKFADFSAAINTEWTIADTNITGVTIPFQGQNIPAIAKIMMTGKRVSVTSEIINNVTYPNTTKFELTLSITPSLTFLGQVVPINTISVKQYIWVAENVGIVKEEFPNVDLAITALGQVIAYKGDGLKRELVRYSIK